jgi:hypothetical protein
LGARQPFTPNEDRAVSVGAADAQQAKPATASTQETTVFISLYSY